MSSVNIGLDDLTNVALKRLVMQLLSSGDGEERKIINSLTKKSGGTQKNDLADLDEEMHGKPNTPEVEDDDIEDGEELPEVPKKRKK